MPAQYPLNSPVAHDEADTGNPIKIGGYASATVPTAVASGDRVNGWYGLAGQTTVGSRSNTAADGYSNSFTFLMDQSANAYLLGVGGSFFNGSTWDRSRNNVAASYLASAARTATPSVSDITTYNARGIRVSIDVTAIAASPSVVPTIEVKDAVAGTYTAILTGAAIVGTGHTELVVMPGITPAANVAAAMALARTMRVSMTHGDADSITYSVAVELLV